MSACLSPRRRVVALVALGLVGPGLAAGQAPRTATGTGGKTRPVSYRLTAGREFGYYVDIRVETPARRERFVGTPVFTVRSVDRERNKAVVVAIGRLASYTTSAYTKVERAQPDNDVWIGTKIDIDLKGRGLSGYGDYQAEALPDALLVLNGLKRLIFVDLPDATPGAIESSGHKSVHLDSNSSKVTRKFQGQETYSVRSEAASADLVRLEKKQVYVVTNKQKPIEFRYQATTLFSRSRGLPESTEATYTHTEGDARFTTTVTVRLLDGEYLQQAQARAKEDWKELPPSLDPREFRRVRLDVKQLPPLRSLDEARPGLVVGHGNKRDGDWYLAEIVKVISRREIKVRYRGSDEEFQAELNDLGIPPARLVPRA